MVNIFLVISIDRKTLRCDKSHGIKSVNMVSAWLSDCNVVMG